MKKTLLALATVFMALGATFYITSCTDPDPCADVECGAHGTCNQGTCDCEVGYEKDTNGRCDVITSALWLADYAGEDFNTAGVSQIKYATKVTAVSTDNKKVLIANLGFYECKNTQTGAILPYDVEGTVKGDSIKIDYKTCNNAFKGTGYFNRSAKTITINYTATYGTAPVKVDVNKAVLTKK